ncbi:MAG: hypothetical protein KC493_13770 [Bacteriovoracaceae bacterium]|nr:hypothetical protein [Bacteriovoracaceae bacterium]
MGEPKIKPVAAKKDLESLKLTKENIETGEYPLEEVFELEHNGQVVGLYWQYDLKDFIQQETSFDKSARIRVFGQNDWQDLFNNSFFQRRKPQLVQVMDPQKDEEFFLLDQGQKSGPWNSSEINEMLENKTILLTDMISIDDGVSWGKVFEVEEFDRRQMNVTHKLPEIPEEEVLRSHEEKVIEKIQNQDIETDAIAGLAYIGNMKLGKVTDEQHEAEEIIEEDSRNTQWIQIFWIGLFVISLVGIVWLFYPSSKSTNSTKGTKLGKVAPIQKLKPSKTWKAPKAAKKAPTRAPALKSSKLNTRTNSARSRTTTPFKKTKTYQRAQEERSRKQNSDHIKVENYDNEYYDDASDPVELDPVRKTLSKETIDPEDEQYEYNDTVDQLDPTMENDPAMDTESY